MRVWHEFYTTRLEMWLKISRDAELVHKSVTNEQWDTQHLRECQHWTCCSTFTSIRTRKYSPPKLKLLNHSLRKQNLSSLSGHKDCLDGMLKCVKLTWQELNPWTNTFVKNMHVKWCACLALNVLDTKQTLLTMFNLLDKLQSVFIGCKLT